MGAADSGEAAGAAVSAAFAALRAAQPRLDVLLEEVPAPGSKVATAALALEAELLPLGEAAPAGADIEPLAIGRFVVLHDPKGQPGWLGAWRVVVMVQAPVDESMGRDPLLAEVTWSWLMESLAAHGLTVRAERGTVTATASRSFGRRDNEPEGADDECELELRCSWSPGHGDDLTVHLAAFCDLLGAVAGVPAPEVLSFDPVPSTVVPLRRV